MTTLHLKLMVLILVNLSLFLMGFFFQWFFLRSNKHFKNFYRTGFVIGYLSNDTLTMAGLTVKNVEFGEILWMADFFADIPLDGILGLGYPSIAQDGVVPVFDMMMQQKLLEKNQFSVFLSNIEGDQSSALLLGGTDPKYYEGTFVYSEVIYPSYWLVGADYVYVNGKILYTCDFTCPTGIFFFFIFLFNFFSIYF